MPVLSEALGKPALIAALVVIAAAPRHLGLAASAASGAGRMMLAWILSPIGRWLSLVGAVFAALGCCLAQGPGCRQGRLAGTRRQAAKAKAMHHIFGDLT